MGHPAIENNSPFAFEVLFLVDEELRPLVVPVIKGTFDIVSGLDAGRGGSVARGAGSPPCSIARVLCRRAQLRTLSPTVRPGSPQGSRCPRGAGGQAEGSRIRTN